MGSTALSGKRLNLSCGANSRSPSPRLHHAPELLPTGIAEVDVLLEGGLPLGGLRK